MIDLIVNLIGNLLIGRETGKQIRELAKEKEKYNKEYEDLLNWIKELTAKYTPEYLSKQAQAQSEVITRIAERQGGTLVERTLGNLASRGILSSGITPMAVSDVTSSVMASAIPTALENVSRYYLTGLELQRGLPALAGGVLSGKMATQTQMLDLISKALAGYYNYLTQAQVQTQQDLAGSISLLLKLLGLAGGG